MPLVIFMLLVIGETVAWSGTERPDLDRALGSLKAGEPLSVIVRLAERMDLERLEALPMDQRRKEIIKTARRHAAVNQEPLRALLVGRKLDKPVVSLWLINAMALSADAETLRELRNHPLVRDIRLDRTIQLPQTASAVPAPKEWNIISMGAPELWSLGYRGQGVVVASMDSGVDVAHPDLKTRYRGGTNSWYDPSGEHSLPYDADGHGTQTMGIVVGGAAGGSAIGVAPGARWIAAKIFDDNGRASLSNIHLGFQWLMDPDGNPETDDAPDVVNNSWGLDQLPNHCDAEFRDSVRALRAAGIAVVFAGGNSGPMPETSLSPANYPEAFAVGAADSQSMVDTFSSRGPSPCDGDIYPEVLAPGVNVKTSSLTYGGIILKSYTQVSGTSFAAPHAAGAMALLLNAFPGLKAANVEWALKATAMDLGDPGPDNDYGYGLLDVAAAYRYLKSNPPLDPTPPKTSGLRATPQSTQGISTATLTATGDDSATGGSPLAGAEWWRGPDPGKGKGTSMMVVDGAFNSPLEDLMATLDVSGWPLGSHVLSVRSRDGADNWGGIRSYTLNVTDRVTITGVRCAAALKGITVWATSTAGGPGVALRAVIVTGGVARELGALTYRSNTGQYTGTFHDIDPKPDRIRVHSSLGGFAARRVPL
jgi:bacillopeptidase F